jgi:hypothetical protein
MPAGTDTPELVDSAEIHDLHREQPPARKARPGFWRTRAHKITRHLTLPPRERYAPVYRVPRPFESSMDRLVREYPPLSILAMAII